MAFLKHEKFIKICQKLVKICWNEITHKSGDAKKVYIYKIKVILRDYVYLNWLPHVS